MKKQVALVQCSRYETERVEKAVRRAVDLLGGMERFVQPGQRVVVKPNFLLSSDPERAIVTHPLVIRAVVLLAQEAGGRVLIADNPGAVPVTSRGWQSLYERVGCDAVAAETGCELHTHLVPQRRSHPDGELIKMVDTSNFVTEADVIISVPKLKTHGLMRFTGAVKNLFGTVPGTTKFGYHVKLQTADLFADMLLDLVSFVRPALTVMDAIIGMDGDGPSAGQPFPIGAIVAGPDPVSVDIAALSLVGQEPASVLTVSKAIQRGWTSGRVADLDLLGDELDSLRVEGFRMPAGGRTGMGRAPDFLRQWGTQILVPSPVVTERCIGCGLCIESCPAETITQVEGKAQINLSNCIRCYCCHELCPEHAIELHQPWLGRVLTRLAR